ncbi:hypothetical protein MMC16_002048 [Acarospora aff. strigata]|nr:hypothetical protein [Acarospora aff. strigata]
MAGVLPSLPEIRNEIYRLLFVKSYAIRALCDEQQIFNKHSGFFAIDDEEALTERAANSVSDGIALLRVSKQTHTEAIPFFYGAPNSFWLYSREDTGIENWLKQIGMTNRLLLGSLKLDWCYGAAGTVLKLDVSSNILELYRSGRDYRPSYHQMLETMKTSQDRTIDSIQSSLSLLAESNSLRCLSLDLPGINRETLEGPVNDLFCYQRLLLVHNPLQSHQFFEALTQFKRLIKIRVGPAWSLKTVETMARSTNVKDLEVFGDGYDDWVDLRWFWEGRMWMLRTRRSKQHLLRRLWHSLKLNVHGNIRTFIRNNFGTRGT